MSADDVPPSVLCLTRERSINSINCGLVLKAIVSKSTFSSEISAATGTPSLVRITGSLPSSSAYSAKVAVASESSRVFINQIPFHQSTHGYVALCRWQGQPPVNLALRRYHNKCVDYRYEVPTEPKNWDASVCGFLSPRWVDERVAYQPHRVQFFAAL